jgi:predicted flap endonuclease-1-like 5' DNA nuclease
VEIRQKLTEFESTIAFVIGGGLILMMLVFGLASASGGSDVSRLNLFLVLGALLFFGGTIVWLFASRPWLNHDDWSEPLYTGHEHEAHHAEPAEAHEAPAEALAHVGAAEPSELAAAMNIAPALEAAIAAVEAAAAPDAPAAQATPQSQQAEQPESAYVAVEQPAYAQVSEGRVPDQPAEPEQPATAPDDLTLIEGIGPKISAALIAAGVDTFAKLAALQPDQIENIVRSAGVRMVGKAETWAKQAQLAAEGKFEELKAYQKTLTAGRSASD